MLAHRSDAQFFPSAATLAYTMNHACANCGQCGKTPQTRRGPAGNATLCNACGSRLLKGTYLTESAASVPHCYPVDHAAKVVFWPGQETRHGDMLDRLSEVREIARLLQLRDPAGNNIYSFFYNRGTGAEKAKQNLKAFIARYGMAPRA